MIRVFLDANVYFAGFFSKQGASAVMLELARRKKIELLATQLVLKEADRNLRKKASSEVLTDFRRFLNGTKIQISLPPTEEMRARCESLIHFKDIPILATALEAKVDFLITLDRKHFLTESVLTHSGKTKILTPADFIIQELKRHKI